MNSAADRRGDQDLPSGVGLVHDYLLTMRGAERTFAAIADCWPDAPIYTTLYSLEGTERRFASREVRTSYLQRLGVRQRGFRRLLPLYPARSRAAPCVGARPRRVEQQRVRPRREAEERRGPHLLLPQPVPLRMARERGRAERGAPWARPLVRRMLTRIRRWDLQAAARVTHYIANSELTRDRITRLYGRDATVIHPPVEIDWLEPGTPEDFFLVVTELAPHKRVHVASRPHASRASESRSSAPGRSSLV